jgi:GcrA cell cycle regulator
MGEAMHYTPRSAPNVKWDDDLDAVLVKHTEDGKSASEIAAIMGMGLTRNAIAGRWKRLRDKTGLKVPEKIHVSQPRDPKPAKAVAPSQPPPLAKSQALLLDVGIADMPRAKRGRLTNSKVIGTACSSLPLPAPIPLVNGARIGLLQLSDKTCKWPIGDPGTADFCFCGHAPRENSPYCEFHARAAYVPLLHRRHRVFASPYALRASGDR